MATKKELEDQVKQLKEKIKDLTNELKVSLSPKEDADLGERPHRAIGLFKDKEAYKFARIDYNPETKATVFTSIEDASRVPDAAHLAKYNLEEIITDEIIARLEEDYV